ncbi:HD domain-containing protein [candidate division KSB1 bacterium]|nr:HD domain-containing protein [candidate division KSB1 bacterium]
MIDHKDIETLFEDLLVQIENRELAEKVVQTWVLACKQGNWNNVEDLKKIPFTLLVDVQSINFIEHTIAVTEGAIGLARAQISNYQTMPYSIDIDALIAGGLLHDVGKLVEFESDGSGGFRQSYSGKCARHPISGAILAAAAGLPDNIINIIACHAKEGEGRPQCIETVLIHQADFATFDPLLMLGSSKLILS